MGLTDFKVNFICKNAGWTTSMPLFFLAVMLIISAEIIYNRIFGQFWLNLGMPVAFSYLIAVLAYCYFYTTFIKEGYYIPNSITFKIACGGSMILIFLMIYIDLFLGSNPDTLIKLFINSTNI